MRRRSIAFLSLLAAVALISGACQRAQPPTEPGEEAQRGGRMVVELSEPGSLDPAHADDSEEIIIVRRIFEGLVVYDSKTAEAKPGVATRWESNADSTVWTFTLRRDNTFSNGEPVTAESFVRGWTRITAKNEESEIAYHLAGINGYTEHNESDVPALSGVRAVDQFTFEVTLTDPDPEFAVKVGHTAFLPLPSDAAIAGQQPSWGEFPIGNGPFMLKSPEPWKHNQSVTMVRNPTYKGGRAEPFLDEVEFRIFADFDTAYLEWQAGNLDYSRIPPAKLAEAESQYADKILKEPTSVLTYLLTNTAKAPTDNKLVRQAISMAIDREAINQAVFNGTQFNATGIIPPVMPGFRSAGACEFCKYDPARAKQLYDQSGARLTSLQIHFNAGAGHEQWVQAVADQLKTNLGVPTVELVPRQPFSEYLSFLNTDAYSGLGRLGWGMDYPTPQNFLFPLAGTESIGHDNYSRYSNPQFDALLKRAGTIDNVDERIKVYQQAEDILVEDLPFLPLWFRLAIRLANLEEFGGLEIDPFDDPTVETAFVRQTSS